MATITATCGGASDHVPDFDEFQRKASLMTSCMMLLKETEKWLRSPSEPNSNLNLAVIGLKPGSAARIKGHNRIYVVEIPYSLTEAHISTTPAKILSLTQAVTEKELVNDADSYRKT
ncbi:splicing factor U2af large subunit B [Artemisia annua]|uniref:Splicing factor U2af large subunit B n=1 Tax=Artemisia annua TaxID=35608 RepID=A0A2U1MIV3_ARTAN|nr:splicing factor U2af large subunit B [Artemisia annua]